MAHTDHRDLPDGWSFHQDPRTFLPLVADLVAADPLQYTILQGYGHREAERFDRGVPTEPGRPYWYALHVTEGRVDAAAMRTAPWAPYPLWVPAISAGHARSLADALVATGEATGEGVSGLAVNGMQPAATVLAEALAAETSRTVRVLDHQRLFRLDEVHWPQHPTGTLRLARPEEAGVLTTWLDAFEAEADEQAGKAPAAQEADPKGHTLDAEEVLLRIGQGEFWVWADARDEPVHLTAARRVQDGIAGLGPVYTPQEHRGHGFAGWTVAALSQQILDAGGIPFLYTDQANPVSNRLYESLGYRPVSDAVRLELA